MPTFLVLPYYRKAGVEAVRPGNTRRVVGRAAGGDTLACHAVVLHSRHRVRLCGRLFGLLSAAAVAANVRCCRWLLVVAVAVIV